MISKYVLIFLASFISGLIFLRIFKRISLKMRVLTFDSISLVGGLSIGLAFLFVCTLIFWFPAKLNSAMTGILISSFVMLVFGLIDDLYELSVSVKLLVQIVATAILVFSGTRTNIAYIGDTANIAITFIWVLGILNAFNHLDVLDGLAAGSALIISLTFFVIAIFNGDVMVLFMSLILCAAVSSFLIYNLPPAKVYMGNSGSHFLGFVLAAVALSLGYASLKNKIGLLSPLLILGLPIFDTAFLIFVRLLNKRIPFRKSSDHLALRFLTLGYSKIKALIAMLSLCLFFCICGVAVSRVSNIFGGVIVFVAFLVSLAVAYSKARVVVNE